MFASSFSGAPDRRNVEDSAAEVQRQVRGLIDRLPALIGYWDRDGRNVIANQAYLEYFGMSPEQIRGRHLREVLGAALYTLNLPYIQGVLDGYEQLFERILIDHAGQTRSTQVSYVPDIVDGQVLGFYAQVIDVTAREEAERARDEAIRLFEISMRFAPIGKVVIGEGGVVLQANPAICRVLGCAERDIVGFDFRRFVHPNHIEASDTHFAAVLDGATPHVTSDLRCLRADGTSVWLQCDLVRVPGVHQGRDLAIAQFQDVTVRRQTEAELARLAVTDHLTGLYNRHALVDSVERLHATDPDKPIGVIFIDLDGFKQVNDTRGHTAGDVVLAAAARRLARIMEPPNTAYRLGGDEFVVLVPTPASGLAELAQWVVEMLSGPYETDTKAVTLEASVGYACEATGDIDVLLRAADAAMYRHKARPR